MPQPDKIPLNTVEIDKKRNSLKSAGTPLNEPEVQNK